MERLQNIHKAIEAKMGARVYKLFRYLTSGGTAALVNWITLFLLVHWSNMYYLYASVVAFGTSIAVSFILQKFWTFQDRAVQDIHLQFSRYLIIILLSLALNTVLVYLLVEKMHIWYLLAQVIATVVIAITNFFCYTYFVFSTKSSPKDSESVS